jgi:hypothetical protein
MVTWPAVYAKVAEKYGGTARAQRAQTTLQALASLTSGYGRSDWATFLLPAFIDGNAAAFGDMTLAQGDLNIIWDAMSILGGLQWLSTNDQAMAVIATMGAFPATGPEQTAAASALIAHYVSREYFNPTADEQVGLAGKTSDFIETYRQEVASQQASWIDFFPGEVWNSVRNVAKALDPTDWSAYLKWGVGIAGGLAAFMVGRELGFFGRR